MSLLGIDVGTTGCKSSVFSQNGTLLAAAYAEYDICRGQPGWAEIDALEVWGKVKHTIRQVVPATTADPIRALSVSSMGEAVVPVTLRGEILGPSILNFDVRGEEYLPGLRQSLPEEQLYQINGNSIGNNYGLTKLMWIKHHQPDLYERAERFLHWSGFVTFMLGSDPVEDYSIANRSLLFDLERGSWSPELLQKSGIDSEKLPVTCPSGQAVGSISARLAAELGLPHNVQLVSGAHDQCANAVGAGVIEDGQAVFGMGTFICITPVFSQRRSPAIMLERGLNTEQHAVAGKYVSFIYNPGGALVKWYRDTFALAERNAAQISGQDIYDMLFAEMPDAPSKIIVLPHFAQTGPPEFIADSCGVMVGVRLETTRGEILKGIVEGISFYLKECVESLPPTGIAINQYRAAGGGSKSDLWLQVCADIFGRPFTRLKVTEAGSLGAAILAGSGSGVFASINEGVEAMVRTGQTFEPDPRQQRLYLEGYEKYKRLWPLMKGYLHAW